MSNWTSSAGLRPNASSNGMSPPYVTRAVAAAFINYLYGLQ